MPSIRSRPGRKCHRASNQSHTVPEPPTQQATVNTHRAYAHSIRLHLPFASKEALSPQRSKPKSLQVTRALRFAQPSASIESPLLPIMSSSCRFVRLAIRVSFPSCDLRAGTQSLPSRRPQAARMSRAAPECRHGTKRSKTAQFLENHPAQPTSGRPGACPHPRDAPHKSPRCTAMNCTQGSRVSSSPGSSSIEVW